MTSRPPARDPSSTRTLDRVKAPTAKLPAKPAPADDEMSSTTLKAVSRKPASGGAYNLVKPTGAADVTRCDVTVDGHNVRIEAGGTRMTLSRGEARTLADKLARALR